MGHLDPFPRAGFGYKEEKEHENAGSAIGSSEGNDPEKAGEEQESVLRRHTLGWGQHFLNKIKTLQGHAKPEIRKSTFTTVCVEKGRGNKSWC